MIIEGKGTVSYNIIDDNETPTTIIINNVYHVPKMDIRLISPQQLAKQSRDPNAGLLVSKHICRLLWDFHTKTLKYNEHSNLPIIYTTPDSQALYDHNKKYNSTTEQICFKELTEEPVYKPYNKLTRNTQNLLKWHERLGHMNFKYIQQLSIQGFLPSNISSCQHPICPSYQFGKAHKRATNSGITKVLGQNKITKPCQLIHMDQAHQEDL